MHWHASFNHISEIVCSMRACPCMAQLNSRNCKEIRTKNGDVWAVSAQPSREATTNEQLCNALHQSKTRTFTIVVQARQQKEKSQYWGALDIVQPDYVS